MHKYKFFFLLTNKYSINHKHQKYILKNILLSVTIY